MGLLDDNYALGGFGPWNAFYASPLQGPDAATVSPQQPASSPAPDSTIAFGDYQPQFGAPASPPSAPAGAAASASYAGAYGGQGTTDGAPGFTDRLTASLASIAHSKGLFPSIVNGLNSFASGARTDPDAVSDNLTARALQARGASAADTQAALGNPAVMQALIQQYYGSAPRGPTVGATRPAAAAGDNTDAPGQGGAASTPGAPAAPPPLTVPTRPRLQVPPARAPFMRRGP